MMEIHKQLFAAFILFGSLYCRAQVNLVPNPSFEDTMSCPNGNSEITKARYWDNCGWGGTSDYFYNCNQGQGGVPTNAVGYQYPATGNGYAGFISYSGGSGLDQREYIFAKLTATLAIGQKYYISFKVSRADDTLGAGGGSSNNKLGVRFRTVPCSQVYDPNRPFEYPDNFSHAYTNTIITDRINWTSVCTSFIADSAYQYIVIGNFFKDAQTNAVHATTPGFNGYYYAYYYIDDVSVSTASAACQSATGIHETETVNSTVHLSPNPTKGLVRIISEGEEISSVSVQNIDGAIVSFVSGVYASDYMLDLSAVQSGIYFLKIDLGHRIIYKRIIRQ